jgi:hypothetical protein
MSVIQKIIINPLFHTQAIPILVLQFFSFNQLMGQLECNTQYLKKKNIPMGVMIIFWFDPLMTHCRAKIV